MRNCTRKLRAVAAMLMLLLFSAAAMAQSAIIKGTIKDATGAPLNGASVTVEGRPGGTVTDVSGIYTLRVPAGSYTLIISFIGQSTQRIPVTLAPGATITQDVTLTTAANENVVRVVGTRSRLPRSSISTPVPVDVITTREVKSFAQADVSQLLTYVAPSFQSSRQTISDGTDHIDPAGLRGLGPDQTLVLLNGKRRHTTALVNINGTVGRGSVGTDLNAIPVAAIERIEVLRDGAAAQYGSDAIAGVINIVTRTKYKGFQMSGYAGKNFTTTPVGTTNQRIGDGGNVQVDFTAGTFSKSGAYINASGQYYFRDRSNRSGFDNYPLIYLGNVANADGFPATQTGVDPVQYRRFLIEQDRIIVAQRGYSRQNIVAGNSRNDNFGTIVNGGFPIGKKVSFYTTLGAAHRNGDASGFSRNPNAITQNPITSDGNYYYPDGFLPEIHTRIEDVSAITGFKGDFGGWDVDLSNTYGKNSIFYRVENSGNASLPASTTVQTQFDAGNLKFDQNTVNLDLSRDIKMSGSNNLNVAFGGEYRHERYQIGAGEAASYANGGRVASYTLPAYPGTQYGTTVTGLLTGAGAQVFPGFRPSDALNVSRNVYAGYADLEYTIGKLLVGAAGRYEKYKERDVDYDGTGLKVNARYEILKNLAIRGSFNTGFRAPSLHQRYFQNTSTQFVGGLPTTSLTANNENPIVRNVFGIQELKPETSRSFTGGVATQFGKGFTLTVDGYYIKINDRVVLSTAFQRGVPPAGTGGNPLITAILGAYNVDPSITALQFWTNAINTETKGIDLVLSKRYNLNGGSGNISLAGNYNRNSVVGGINTNSVLSSAANNPSLTDPTKDPSNDLNTGIFDRQQRARLEVGQPRSKVNLTANYTYGKFDFLARVVHFGKITQLAASDPYLKNPTTGAYFNDIGFGTDQTFRSKVITDIVVTYIIRPGINFSVGANNLLDVYPDRIFVDPRNSLTSVYANPVRGTLGADKIVGGYNASRDLSNRGRLLFNPNQFGFNGRFLFGRLTVDFGQLWKKKVAMVKNIPPPPPPPPADRDKDGTPDFTDACPDQPGPAMLKGCPDRDGDGIADKDDACPDEKGTVATKGCPDRDNDGVVDSQDKCPDVPGSPLPQYQGCPIPDTDGDGVRDDIDKCPTVKGTFANAGCPEAAPKPTAVEMQPAMDTAAKRILFQTGKAVLTTSSYGALDAIAESLQQNTDVTLTIEGHTDNVGSTASNQVLSEKRANTVKAYLTKKGIDASRMTVEGYGETKPRATNATAAGRALNRRVVLRLQ